MLACAKFLPILDFCRLGKLSRDGFNGYLDPVRTRYAVEATLMGGRSKCIGNSENSSQYRGLNAVNICLEYFSVALTDLIDQGHSILAGAIGFRYPQRPV